MQPEIPTDWQASKALAKAMLHDRSTRRRAMGRSVLLLLAVFATGLWGIDGWLRAELWRFVVWWGGCGLLAIFVVMFALYDACAVIREERDRM
ncbi:MAG: hypothetical protein EAZ65_09410 [Verrucomicrobia bacterium]|nr:MAG: hypothetical protein EAZ84_08675 [Verrucomicrobiota bacterium]TAE86667.1 MAG: hypothetical protein EAZ82_10440 [Verrucomicrobiota bacterium]TAF24446.1 MAG: hypothetical protein EAZ71_10670 [Verrucomicrobiota bacterium]TAF40007.1 MAG: hypothetical protein EAZ65_09410 [Verrucomicrobiota bacterium]